MIKFIISLKSINMCLWLIIYTLAAKRRPKGMVHVCLSVCKKIGKTTNIDSANEPLADFKLYKDQK